MSSISFMLYHLFISNPLHSLNCRITGFSCTYTPLEALCSENNVVLFPNYSFILSRPSAMLTY